MIFEDSPLTFRTLSQQELPPTLREAMGDAADPGHPAARAMMLLANHEGDDASLMHAFWTAVHARTFDCVIEDVIETQLELAGLENKQIDTIMQLFRIQVQTVNAPDVILRDRLRIFLQDTNMHPDEASDWLPILDNLYTVIMTTIEEQGIAALGISEDHFIARQNESARRIIDELPLYRWISPALPKGCDELQSRLVTMLSRVQISAHYDL